MDQDTGNPDRERLLAEIGPLREEMKTLKAGQKKRRREIRLALAILYADADDVGAFVGQDSPSYHAKKDQQAISEEQMRARSMIMREARRRAAATTSALMNR